MGSAAPTVHALTGTILAAVQGDATSLDTRGEGIVLTFEAGGAAFRLQLDLLQNRHTDKEEA